MFIDSFRRGGFVILACAVIAVVCGGAMIAEALRRRIAALSARNAPPAERPAGPTHGPLQSFQ